MNKAKWRRMVGVLLAVLLIMGFSLTAYAAEAGDTMRLDTPDESGNTAFSVDNMFPGDAETKDFTVKVNHKKPITLYYHADIRPGYEKLAEVLMVKIELPGKGLTLYDGLMRDMPSALEHTLSADEKQIVYRITAYLDTSVGNDYQYKSLIADFRWWYEEETEPTAAAVKLAAEKVLDGQYPRGHAFTFVLKDEAGNVIQTVKNRDGIVEFDTLHFDKSGTYIYYITEQSGSDSNIQYDTAVYKATVTVTEGADAFEAAVSYEKDGEAYSVLPRFVNKTKGGTTPIDPDDPSKPDVPDNPKTGDDSPIVFYTVLMIVSLAALFFILILTKRRKEGQADE